MSKIIRLWLPINLGLALTVLLILSVDRQAGLAAGAQAAGPAPVLSPQNTLRYVAVSGVDTGACTDALNPCRTPQYAVDQAAAGDEIRIATGVYTGVLFRAGFTQTVYLSKSLALRGGYTTTDWTTPDRDAYPTILDPQSNGRGILILGPVTTTLEGLQITGGQSAGAGNPPGLHNAGGGIYAVSATVELRDSRIFSNTAGFFGGGIFLADSRSTLLNNEVSGNVAAFGGGLYGYLGEAILFDNVFSRNHANTAGGAIEFLSAEIFLSENTIRWNSTSVYHSHAGINIIYCNGTVINNSIIENQAEEYSGGLAVSTIDEVITITGNLISGNIGTVGAGAHLQGAGINFTGNRVIGNHSEVGGGLAVREGAMVAGNLILENTATAGGGGVFTYLGGAEFSNNIIAHNTSTGGFGNAVFIFGASPLFTHNTIADNRGGDGTGIHVREIDENNPPSSPTFLNTILVSHTQAVTVTAGNAIQLEGTLWGAGGWANGADWGGEGTVLTGTVNIWGDPGFAAPGSGDYHIYPGSAAIDAGVNAGLISDIDGDPRPIGPSYDIGADEFSGIRYVATTGTDLSACLDPDAPCRTPQYAVDQAAPGDEIRIAGGVYTDVHARPRADEVTTGIVTQVVYLTKTVSLRGGYTVTDWLNPDPALYTTTLDAGAQGRVVYLTGPISPTIENLNLIHGNATIFSPGRESRAGGGFFAYSATVTISSSVIQSSTAGSLGGGVFFNGGNASLMGNTITDNVTGGEGGGVTADRCGLTLTSNRIENNLAGEGGGLFAWQSALTLTGNTIAGNTIDGLFGGGVYAYQSNFLVSDNQILTNYSDWLGGGLILYDSTGSLTGNMIAGNTARDNGGGVHLYQSDSVEVLSNTITGNSGSFGAGGYFWGDALTIRGNKIFDNQAVNLAGGFFLLGNAEISANEIIENSSGFGAGALFLAEGIVNLDNNIIARNLVTNTTWATAAGVAVVETDVYLRNNTIAANRGADGSGIYISGGGGGNPPSTVYMTNTVLVSHTVGITVTDGGTAALEGTLWGAGEWANGTDWGGAGTILTGTVNIWGNPAFADPASGDYHLGPGSAAVDTGVDSGLTTDIDGNPRPLGQGFDIGADERASIRYVATTGMDLGPCLDPVAPCRTPQYAVDQAGDQDEIRIATGVYTDVFARLRADYFTTGVVTQVVYLTKSVSLQGGYTVTDWLTPDPAANPTTLDAGGQGRVVYLTGPISPTIEGLRMVYGDTATFGPDFLAQTGGGVFVYSATVTISGSQILSNTAGSNGGGLNAENSTVTLNNNRIEHNHAGGGGGLSASDSIITLIGTEIISNTAGIGGGIRARRSELFAFNNQILANTSDWMGGGLSIEETPSQIISNTIADNHALDYGGGIELYMSDGSMIVSNTITGNTGDFGGGLYLVASNVVVKANVICGNTAIYIAGGLMHSGGEAEIEGNLILGNRATYQGGGLIFWDSASTVSNNIIAGNRLLESNLGDGSGIHSWDSSLQLLQNTIADNRGGDGEGIAVGSGSLQLTNTILVSHTVGITVASGGTASLEGTLWGAGEWANDTDWGGAGTLFTGTVNVRGDPAFADPIYGDYHLRPESAAVDAGVDSSLMRDIDGDPRPVGGGFEIGADELTAGLQAAKRASAAQVFPGERLTFTLAVTNTSLYSLTARITDTLPAAVTPTGVLTWTAFIPAPGGGWTTTVPVTITPGFTGPLTNSFRVTTLEGPAGAATVTVQVIDVPLQGLVAYNDGPTPLGQPTILSATVTAGTHVQYDWQFGDGAIASGQIVTHTFTLPGVYTAAVTAANPVSALTATTQVTVTETISTIDLFLPLSLWFSWP